MRSVLLKLILRLRSTLVIKLALYLLVLTGVIASLALWQAEQDTYRLLVDQARAQARVFLGGIEREIQSYASDLNPNRLNAILRDAVKYEPENLDFSVEHLFIVDSNGTIIASNQPEHIGANLSSNSYVMQSYRENQAVIPAELTYITPAPGEGDEPLPTLDVAIPLHLESTTVPAGAMELEMDLSNSVRILKKRYWDDRRALFAKLALLMGGFGAVSLVTMRWQVISRIGQVSRAAKSISRGDLGVRAPESGGDEIGMLAQTFNRMTDALEKNILDLKRTQILTMTKLAELAEKRDPDTGSHLQRIPLYCRALAEELRRDSPYAEMLTDDYMDALAEASSLHDIGKVGVPDAILQKPGPLTPDEFEIIRRHPLIGADVLSGAEFLAMARDIALCHHERYDGKGYPHGLAGEEIPLSARIVAVADMYDALTSRRAYKEALSHAQAFEMLKEPVSHERAATILAKQSGRHFDPEVMRALLRSEAAFREIRDRFSD